MQRAWQNAMMELLKKPPFTRAQFSWFLLAAELVLCSAVVTKVAYTEIDWIAYMQEVEGFLGGELDYTKLKGDTGPLVYPAAFVYIYAFLHAVTEQGTDIRRAQWIFVGVYLLVVAVVFRLYSKLKLPMKYFVPLVLSKRIHSIFVLRMFNDGVAMLFLYTAVLLIVHIIDRRHANKTSAKGRLGPVPIWLWPVACVFYSLAVGVKMNIFLFAPGLLVVLLANMSLVGVVGNLAVCAWIQLAIGLPFLWHDWQAYLSKAFELSRVFTYKWTVNLKWMDEETFVSPVVGQVLLGCTLVGWLLLYLGRWRHRDLAHSPAAVAATLFESNLVGVIFARTLHYQFYVWFFHTLPFLLFFSLGPLSTKTVKPEGDHVFWQTHQKELPMWLQGLLLVVVEIAFNVFPATAESSGMLTMAMACLFLLMLRSEDRRHRGDRLARP